MLLINGVCGLSTRPPSQAFLPLLVTEEHFPNAVAWSSSIFQSAISSVRLAGGIIYGYRESDTGLLHSPPLRISLALLLLSAVRPRAVERPRGRQPPSGVCARRFPVYLAKQVGSRRALARSVRRPARRSGGAAAVYAREILKPARLDWAFCAARPAWAQWSWRIVVAHWPLRRQAGTTMLRLRFRLRRLHDRVRTLPQPGSFDYRPGCCWAPATW